MAAFYNEIDPQAAAWLRVLIEKGHIAPGVVDERSIEDICPAELEQYTQCHFFAGIGVWSYALRSAGWDDTRPVWTGSCPCQPFSAAGKGTGFDDERHLWPSFAWLIQECRPPVVFGEQVASKAVEPWVDLVHADVEAMGYAFGCVPFPSAGVGAPHIRDRAYWVADAHGKPCKQGSSLHRRRDTRGDAQARPRPGGSFLPGSLGHASCARLEECIGHTGMAGGSTGACQGETSERAGVYADHGAAGPTNGFWRAADWLGCRDGKRRPVEPGSFPLVARLASGVVRGGDISQQVNEGTEEARVMRLRGYGNAINAEASEKFISVVMEVLDGC